MRSVSSWVYDWLHVVYACILLVYNDMVIVFMHEVMECVVDMVMH